uniref:procollagen-proline 4-dioxygenase n=1 Tax=Plectus sambesii TaxID=2011161 RepID=A0A914VG48_9BILA
MLIQFLCFTVIYSKLAFADLFSSSLQLEQSLIETEANFVRHLSDYIKKENSRLNRLTRILNELKKSDYAVESLAKVDITERSNPIDAFLGIRRVIRSRSAVLDILFENVAEDILAFLIDAVKPQEEDLLGVTNSLLRLQDTYRLEAKDIANGMIGSFDKTTPMTSDDCFLIGKTAASITDYYHAMPWLSVAEEKMDTEAASGASIQRTFTRNDLYSNISHAMFAQGNVEHALWYIRKLRETDPSHPSASSFYEIWQSFKDSGRKWDGSWESLPPVSNPRPMDGVDVEYEALCRGEAVEKSASEKEKAKLFCFLQRNTPFQILAPMKVEIINHSPYMAIFRGLLIGNEADRFKAMASDKLKSQKSFLDNVSYRVVKTTAFKDSYDEIVARVSKRIGEVTSFSMESAESTSVANYGIGGHYGPHCDVAQPNDLFTNEHNPLSFNKTLQGDRLATVLFYLSTPKAGGATVFFELGVSVPPVKNDALFWFNIKKNGDGDFRSLHASCPVLLGQKWVANKWIHERGQEFRYPCDLSPDV